MKSETTLKFNIEKALNSFFQSSDTFSIIPLKGGGNNRVFLVEHDNQQFVLKHYFQNPKELHSRIEAEYQFINYAWNLGIRNIPTPIAKIAKEHFSIFSYIKGKAPTQQNLKVDEALDFLIKLNFNKKNPHNLANAKESCFCFQDYIDTVDQKFSKLVETTKNEESIQLLDFLKNSFQPKWAKVKSHFLTKRASELKIKFPNDELFITPSDFGFHNMIVNNNETYFIDFEYAGIDDIAKTICDFFCQPKYPVPLKYLTNFVASLLQFISDPIHCVRRIRDLMPICQMKWCCIMLNIFLKDGKKRREFADSYEMESIQLNKAIQLLNNINEEFLWPI